MVTSLLFGVVASSALIIGAAIGVRFDLPKRVLAILLSIGLHELGHLVPAKKFGAKVPQWFIGFGPTVRSKQIGETEYGIPTIFT